MHVVKTSIQFTNHDTYIGLDKPSRSGISRGPSVPLTMVDNSSMLIIGNLYEIFNHIEVVAEMHQTK